ncbi:MAG TPA: class I SAM-dependent methyltransferase [Solirubrobacterales bacterium]|nr:class I SAM-dependent methyltransferase [Solirubrobacterales bacterium]
MNANRELWEKGDFTRIAAAMRGSGEALVGSLGVDEGMTVLDLGCGDGTTAVPAARLGADVLGVDIAANLVAAGQARAAAEGLDNLRFEQGDATDLSGLEDDRFDLVVSVFGAMFAPKPESVAKEMVRVAKPDGRVVMANWIPGDPTLVAQILRIASSYSPPPPAGFVSPMLWGDPEVVTERFVGAGIPADQVAFEQGVWNFDYEGSPTELVEVFRDYYGPTMNAFAAAREAGREDELRADLDELFLAQNTGVDGTFIATNFLLVNVMCSYPGR